jgi:hypothetical protein
MQKYRQPDGFTYDTNSGLYYRMEYDEHGTHIGTTWFNAMTGEYLQVHSEPKSVMQTEPVVKTEQVVQTDTVTQTEPVARTKPTQTEPQPPAKPMSYALPNDLTLDPNSGYHYIDTSSDNSHIGANVPTAIKRKSPIPIIITLVLVLAIGVGGWFFRDTIAALLIAANNILETTSTSLSASDIPTDKNGVNLVGNHMENLQNGGLITMQGDFVFFANMRDGGALYVTNKDGNAYAKLTGFPVANLNLVGDRLIFTDISESGYVSEVGFTSVGGERPLDIALAMPENALVRFGGSLYGIDGVLDLNADLSNADELTLTSMLEGIKVQSPIWNGGEIIALFCESTGAEQHLDRVIRIDQSGTMNEVVLNGDAYPYLITMLVYGDSIYGEVSTIGGEHRIVKYDIASNSIAASLEGSNLRTAPGLMMFLNTADKLIYDVNPETEEIGLVSNVVCPEGFSIDGAGSIVFTVPKTGGNAHITISRKSKLADEDGKTLRPARDMRGWYTYVDAAKLVFLLSQRIGGDYYALDHDEVWMEVSHTFRKTVFK